MIPAHHSLFTSHHFRLLLRCIVTLAAFYLVWRQVDWHSFTASLATQKLGWVLAACLCICTHIIFGGLRWHQLLTAIAQRTFSSLRIVRLYFASLVFNIFVPGTLGSDMARVCMARSQDIPAGAMVSSVVIDRLFSLFGLLVLIIGLLPFFCERLGVGREIGVIISALSIIAGIIGLYTLKRLLPRVQNIRYLRWLNKLHAPFVLLMQHPGKMLLTLANATVAHIAGCTTYYTLAMSLSLPVSYFDCLVLIPGVMLISALPLSLSGWGVRELSLSSSLALIGIASAPAVLIALQIGLLSTLIMACSGIVYIVEKHKS